MTSSYKDKLRRPSLSTFAKPSTRSAKIIISTVAQRHFNSHVRGSSRPPLPYIRPSSHNGSPVTPPSTTGSLTPIEETTAHESAAVPEAHRVEDQRHTPTYTNALTRSTLTPQSGHRPKRKALPRTPLLDNRLFVRLPEDHVPRAKSTYSIQNDLNKALEKKLVKEIQTTRIGFALCSLSPEMQDSLQALIPQITALFSKKGPCVVEKADNLVRYRIALVLPRLPGQPNNPNLNYPRTLLVCTYRRAWRYPKTRHRDPA